MSVPLRSGIPLNDGAWEFWRSFGLAIRRAAAEYGVPQSQEQVEPMSCGFDFMHYLFRVSWDRDVVLLLDDFDMLKDAPDDIRDVCLGSLWQLKERQKTCTTRPHRCWNM